MSCSFLYVMSEIEGAWEFNESGSFYKRYSTNNSKIGVTESKPYERLRKLKQGNPRELEFTYLWVGHFSDIKTVESIIKGDKLDEWFNITAAELREKVFNVMENRDIQLYEVTGPMLPYKHRSYGRCPWNKSGITADILYSEISGKPAPSRFRITNTFDKMFE